MSQAWKAQRERASPRLLALIVWLALHLGRRATRLLLGPIVLYFFCTAHTARRAARDFLRRAGAPAQGTAGVLRSLHAFAACALDRVFLLSGRYRGIRVAVRDPHNILPYYDRVGGVLVPAAHLGSYDVLRVLGADRKGLRFRIVMDRAHGSMVTSVLEGLNPELANEVIDGGSGGPTLALALKEALQRGCMVGLMADRVTPRDHAVPAPFLGATAQLPDSPWRLAAVLGTPVVLCFGLYRGGSDYELHFEPFLDGGAPVPRAQRAAFIEDCVRRYAARLEHYARSAPYNWFNFYDYWAHDTAGDH